MRIIPAIDIIDGRCVRLTKGDYSTQKVYSENPLEIAKAFEEAGIHFLHLVDLDGAKSGHIVNYRVLNEIASKTSLNIDFGGGLKSNEDLRIAFENGASQISGGSIAVTDRKLFLEWLSAYGPDKIILGADCVNRKVLTHGWQEQSELEVLDFISGYEREGVRRVICTDVSKDGMLSGTSNELYIEIMAKTGVELIASGGVSGIDDLLALQAIGCSGAIVGKAFYEGKITLKELGKLC